MRIAGFALSLSLVVVMACGSKKEAEPAAPAPPAPAAPEPVAVPTAPAEPAAPSEQGQDLNWIAVSADSKVSLSQVGDLRGICTARCVRREGDKEQEIWTAGVCFGRRLDLRFVANDCGRVVVLHQLPKAVGKIPQQAVVGSVFKKDKRDYSINAGTCVHDWSKVRSAGTTFYWLAGTLGVPGDPPRYTGDGKGVEFHTVDGLTHTIPLTVTK